MRELFSFSLYKTPSRWMLVILLCRALFLSLRAMLFLLRPNILCPYQNKCTEISFHVSTPLFPPYYLLKHRTQVHCTKPVYCIHVGRNCFSFLCSHLSVWKTTHTNFSALKPCRKAIKNWLKTGF